MEFSPPLVTKITVAPDADFDATSGTIAFWVKTTGNKGPGDFASIVFDRRTSVGDVITMKDDGTIFVQARPANSFATVGKVNDGEWHHVAYVYDQSAEGSITVYIDGTVSGSQTNSAEWSWPTEQPLEIGRSHDSYWFSFDGALDEFRFYNRQLSATEVGMVGVTPTIRFALSPASQTVYIGDDVLFTSLANGPATYQWQFNSNNIPGQTGTTLTLTNVQASAAGPYTVVASNALGVVTSAPAILVVAPRPSLSDSLVAQYSFDAAPVNNTIIDTAPGSEHPGTNLLATWVANVTGRDGVMQFNSADPGSQIVIPPAADFNSTNGTIAFWLKSAGNLDTLGDFGAIIFDRRTGNGDVIGLRDDGTLFNQAYQSYFVVNSSNPTNVINDDQWHHVAYVYQQGPSGSTRFYIDGQFAGSATNVNPGPGIPSGN
jgi:hypothetical protein